MPYKYFKYKGLEFVLDAYRDGDESVGVYIKTCDFCASDLYEVKVLLYSADFDTVDNREVEYIEFETEDGLDFFRKNNQPSTYKIWCYLSTDEKKLFDKAKERLYKKIKNVVPEPVMISDDPDHLGREFIAVDTDCLKSIDVERTFDRSGKQGVFITDLEHFQKYFYYRDNIKALLDSTTDDPTVQNFEKIVEFFKGVDQEYVERIKPYSLTVHSEHDWWTKFFLTKEELKKEKNRLRVLQPINLEVDVVNNGYLRGM